MLTCVSCLLHLGSRAAVSDDGEEVQLAQGHLGAVWPFLLQARQGRGSQKTPAEKSEELG